jgi:translocation and assembly module TamA
VTFLSLLHSGQYRGVLLCGALLASGCIRLPFFPAERPAAPAPEQPPQIAITVTGVDKRVANSVVAHLSLSGRSCKTPPVYLRALSKRGQTEAQEALHAFGYYQAEARLAVTLAQSCPQVTVTVSPGPRVKVSVVEITLLGGAETDPAFARAVADAPIKVGQPLEHAGYSAAKSLLESLALERGYLEGRFTHSELRVDPAAGSAEVLLDYDSGPRYRVGELRIEQPTGDVDEDLIRRFLDHDEGSPYESRLVSRYYSALSRSEYFEQVEVRPLLTAPEGGTIPIEITLTPRDRHKFSVGLGASTDEGIRTRLNYTNRRLNSAGHRLDANLRASLIEQRLTGIYRIPREHPVDEWLSFNAAVGREDVDTYDTLEQRLGVMETNRRPWGWMETRFIDLNRQSFDIADDSKTTTLVIPGLRWHKVTADHPVYPRRGYGLDAELRGSAEALVSDVDFARFLVSANAVYGLPAEMRLLTRADLGASWSNGFDDLPPSERFFAGGDNSLRGYGFEDLGPEDADGQVIGGKYLAVASIEVDRMVSEHWGIAAFVDAGNAFGGAGSSTGIMVGAGLGLRFRSPIGPARIDLAQPLDGGGGVHLHLRIGPDL